MDKMPDDQVALPSSVDVFDDRFVTEFDGTGNVVDWWLRTEILCEARGVDLMKIYIRC